MKLYHGTSSANAKSIAIEGLLPRRGPGNWTGTGQGQSIENHIYLTEAYYNMNTDFNAARTAVLTNSDCAIIEVEVDEIYLYPDENLFITTIIDKEELKAAQDKALQNKFRWKESLDFAGSVSHRGPIGLDQIKSISTYPIEESRYFCFVSGMPARTIDYFDMMFHTFLHMSHTHYDVLEGQGFKSNLEMFDGNFVLEGTTIKFDHPKLTKYIALDLSGYMRNQNML